MVSVQAHYDQFLAAHYEWMMGDFSTKQEQASRVYSQLGLVPSSGQAADLGCGPGYQAAALCGLGYQVTAIDQSAFLLDVFKKNTAGMAVTPLLADFTQASTWAKSNHFSGISCMGDTLTHLASHGAVSALLESCYQALKPGGWLVLEYRDLCAELKGADRYLTVRSEPHQIMNVFLEYFPQRVMVHDILHRWDGAHWQVAKSCYAKLRLDPAWLAAALEVAGFTHRHTLQQGWLRFFALKTTL